MALVPVCHVFHGLSPVATGMSPLCGSIRMRCARLFLDSIEPQSGDIPVAPGESPGLGVGLGSSPARGDRSMLLPRRHVFHGLSPVASTGFRPWLPEFRRCAAL